MRSALLSAVAFAALLAAPALADPNDNKPKHHDTDTHNPPDAERGNSSGPGPATRGPANLQRSNSMQGPGNMSGPGDGGPDADKTVVKGRDGDKTVVKDRDGDNDKTVVRDRDGDRTVVKDRDGDNDKTIVKDRNGDRTIIKDRDRDNDRTVVRKHVDRSVVLKFRANIRAPHKFHARKMYVRPAGWYPHRWVFGERLPRAFFAPDYFIVDFGLFGLYPPWPGYEWVRYGNDALLVDIDTGEVIRVEYDLFY